MPTVAARLRIRNVADSADLVVFDVGDLAEWPSGDGTTVNVITGAMRSGSYVCRILDKLKLTEKLHDTEGRPQLKSRRAYVEVQTSGGSWVQRIGGFVTRITIRDGHDAEIEVGESLRVPTTARVPGAALGATINRGAIVGGPLLSAWGPIPTLGGWRCTVTAISGRFVTVQIVQTYQPPANVRRTGWQQQLADINRAEAELAPFTTDALTFDFGGGGTWGASATKLSCRLTRVTDGQLSVGPPRVVLTSQFNNPVLGQALFVPVPQFELQVRVKDGDPLPSVSDQMLLSIITTEVTPASPAYLDGHPMDVARALYESIGVTLNTASFDAVKAALGLQLRYAEKVTEPFALQQWIEDTIAGPLGVAFLPDATGAVEAVYMRKPLTAVPTPIITNDDISAIDTVYDDAESGSVARLVWEQAQYVRIAAPTVDDPPDAVLENRTAQDFAIDAGTVYATQTISYTIKGQYYTVGQWPGGPEVISGTQRGQLAQRYGRGAPETRLNIRRDASVAASLAIGTYVRNALSSLPSGTARLATQSGVSRVQQVVGITEGIGERVVTLEDVGPVGGTLSTVPTLSITASGTLYTVEITNATTLAAAGYSVRLEVALTSGGTPATNDWAPLRMVPPAELANDTTVGVTTIPVTIYVRGRAEQDGYLPSAFSTAVSVAITGLPAVTSLAAAAVTGDGSKLAITWARSATDGAVFDVFVRLAADAQGTGVFVGLLPAGSTSVTAVGLTPSTTYTVDVRARAPFGVDQSGFVTTTGTTDSASFTLADPTSVTAFSLPGAQVGVSGTVSGSPLPSVEVSVAVETSVGAGTFGSYTLTTTATPETGGGFSAAVNASADSLLRRLRVRAVRSGATSSGYVVATPDVLPNGLES